MLLETIEEKLRNILEGTLDRLFYPGLSLSLSSQLVQLISTKIQAQPKADQRAPDQITIFIAPEKWDAWQAAQTVLDQAANELETSLSAEGYHFEHKPQMRVLISPELAVDALEVSIGYAQDKVVAEKTVLQPIPRQSSEEPFPHNAYVIINGKDHIPLEKPVINIGRRSTNDIVLSDPMVSRDHAQLRAEQGRYLLFDLSSTGGTYINNHRVHSATLKPGDVIRLGKTILVYNQESLTIPDETKAAVIPPETKP